MSELKINIDLPAKSIKNIESEVREAIECCLVEQLCDSDVVYSLVDDSIRKHQKLISKEIEKQLTENLPNNISKVVRDNIKQLLK